jgi:hypothetical protein
MRWTVDDARCIGVECEVCRGRELSAMNPVEVAQCPGSVVRVSSRAFGQVYVDVLRRSTHRLDARPPAISSGSWSWYVPADDGTVIADALEQRGAHGWADRARRAVAESSAAVRASEVLDLREVMGGEYDGVDADAHVRELRGHDDVDE